MAIIGCADGLNMPQARDGRCTVGFNGDVAVRIPVTLNDMAHVPYAWGETDEITGQANLTGQLPENHSLHVGFPPTTIATNDQGVELFVQTSEDKVVYEPVDGNSIKVEIPYFSDTVPEGQQSASVR